MVHIPIRGLFLLTRVAALAVAAAAIPVVVKQSRPLAKKLGEEFEKFGKWLKDDETTTEPAQAAAKSATKTESKSETSSASQPKVAKKPAVKTTAKKPAPKKSSAKAKAKPKKPAP